MRRRGGQTLAPWVLVCAGGAAAISGAATGLAAAGAQAAAQGPALTHRAQIAPDGVVVAYPDGWSVSQEPHAARIINLDAERLRSADPQTVNNAAQVSITIEKFRTHDEAIQRLGVIRSESTAPATFMAVGTWPALQRRSIEPREQPGDGAATDEHASNLQETAEQKALLFPTTVLRVTTVIAAGDLLVRAEGRLLPNAPASEEAVVRAIEQSLTFRVAGDPATVQRELTRLRATQPRRPRPPPASTVKSATDTATVARFRARRAGAKPAPIAAPLLAPAGAPLRVSNGSEAEIAVSTNGQNILIAQGFNYTRSTNGGLSFSAGVGFTNSNGDGSIAFGRSGTFYAATIGNGTTQIFASTDNGATFPFRATAYTCPPSTNPFPCGFTLAPPASTPFPDQEHVAADRVNASGSGGDQVYSVWRNANNGYGIVCSNDSGNNWSARTLRTGDFPRITVGQDGRVYVVYQNGNGVFVDRFSSCATGLALQVNAAPVATLGPNNWVAGAIPCGAAAMPGLDRCNNGNNLSSFMVAVDDLAANHVYVGYAQSTSATNESVLVQDSTDGGATWPAARTVTVNGGAVARRFMPWVCAAGGVAYINWFDRRAATATNDSLTDYYAGSATRDGAGNLVAGPERRVNALNSADDQCDAGAALGSAGSWPGSARAASDSETCTPQQPQLAGRCFQPGTNPAVGSGQACDFSTASCPTLPIAETCQTGSGVPKFGDYTGNACAAGRFYSIWPSSTPPPPGPPTGGINLYFAALVVAGAQIQIPGPVILPDTCVGGLSVAVANVCNTGKTDLHVDPITSSDPEFGVVTPSSGFPVTIGPSSCFPFDVRFVPTSPGPHSAVLTVPSDDPVTPSATIVATGQAGEPTLALAIADTGQFGTVCPASFRDLPLIVSNPGACPVKVTNITSSAGDFLTAEVLSYPLIIAPGTNIEVPVRFQPASAGAKTATITVTSSDPTNPSKQIRVSGTGGQPIIGTVVADTGSFGKVCTGETRDEMLTVTNSGTCPLVISGMTSSSPEFQMPQVLTYPVTVAPGTSLQVPVRFAPMSAGAKTATMTISSDDPATPSKTVTVTGEAPEEWVCHPPTFAAISMAGGPTFGDTATSDFTFSGEGRVLVPFGRTHSFAVQSEGEFLGYHERYEGEGRAGLLNRWKWIQGGVFAAFKSAEFGPTNAGGTLGQAAFTLDFLTKTFRVNVFGSKGFHDEPGIVRVSDQLGGGGQMNLAPWVPNTYVEGNVALLHQPEPLGNRPGAMLRVSHQLFDRLALTAEITLNESLVGTTNDGRIVVGFVFGRWARPQDWTNRGTPLGTDAPRIRYVVGR